MQDYKKLYIYKRAMEYCEEIYKLTKKFPSSELYNITSQLRRAAISIPLNIAEGAGAAGNKEFSVFISYAYRSCNEVLTALELAERLRLVKVDDIEKCKKMGEELSRMLYSFSKKLKT